MQGQVQLAGVLRVPWQAVNLATGQCGAFSQNTPYCHPVPHRAVIDWPKSASELRVAKPGGPRSEARALGTGASPARARL